MNRNNRNNGRPGSSANQNNNGLNMNQHNLEIIMAQMEINNQMII